MRRTNYLVLLALSLLVGLNNLACLGSDVEFPEKLKFEFWGEIFGGIDGLTTDPRYPHAPDQVHYVGEFNSREAFTDDSHENYGGKLSGWITPTETGDYHFFISSDDSSQLWLSTDDQISNRVKIAEEVGCCHPFQEPGFPNTTADPIHLLAGQKYYVETLWAEGGGGDYCRVAWRKMGDLTPANSLMPIPGIYLSSRADSDTVIVTQQPSDAVVVLSQSISFTVVATPLIPPTVPRNLVYQWEKDGVPIPGAMDATYTILSVSSADRGAYRCVVSLSGATLTTTSRGATLTVVTPIVRTVTTTVDNGNGSLRDHLSKAGNGDTIVFDPAVFPAQAPATIYLATGLPGINAGQVTVDASNAGVILDGSQVGNYTERVLLDDVSLSLDGGGNLLQNGDFSAGLNHWSIQDDPSSSHNRTLVTDDFKTASPSYAISGLARGGGENTFYDTAEQSQSFVNWPFEPQSSVWMPAQAGQAVVLEFWYKAQGPNGNVTVYYKRADGGVEYLVGQGLPGGTTEWNKITLNGTVPSGAVAIALQWNIGHSQSWTWGLTVNSSDNVIRGLRLVHFSGGGIGLWNAHRNTLGGDRAIGSGPLGQGNLISGNNQQGIGLWNASDNLITGNYIGVAINGNQAMPNGGGGLHISQGTNNVIGGTHAGEANIISGNNANGISFFNSSKDNVIIGNIIGLDSSGRIAVPNRGDGIFLGFGGAEGEAPHQNRIGGVQAGERNIISGNQSNGILIQNSFAFHNIIQGNYIGVDKSGQNAIGNEQNGIVLASPNNLVGGTSSPAGNVISGNNVNGLVLTESDGHHNQIIGNLIGTKADGTTPLGNKAQGIYLCCLAGNNHIGGVVAGEANIIAYNQGNGIQSDSFPGNTLRGNVIFSNGGLGIDLSPNGINANDELDADTGPNHLQNYPVLISAIGAETTRIQVLLNSLPNTTFNLDFYANESPDDSLYGEGRHFLGSTPLATDASGSVIAMINLPTAVPVGQWITATANDTDNNTSEFSKAVLVAAPDTEAPTILSAIALTSLGFVDLLFNEPLNILTAINQHNYVINGATVVSATCPDNGQSVRLTVAGLNGTDLTLQLSNLQDASGNTIAPSTPISLGINDGVVQYKFYDNIGGTSLSALTNDVRFTRGNADRYGFTEFLGTPGGYEHGNNYGAQIQGYLTPPVSGSYVFGIYGDDASALFLSTDSSPAHKTLIASVSGWTPQRDYTVEPQQISKVISLQAGKRYFVEVLQKEGGGGDGVGVAWQKPGDPPISDGMSEIPGAYLSAYKTAGPVIITNQPPDVEVIENTPATFVLAADALDGSPLYTFQWLKNGLAIPDATNSSHTMPTAALSENGSSFTVEVANYYGTTVSRNILLSVTPDLTSPTVLSAGSLKPFDIVSVRFSERIDPITATDLSNYELVDDQDVAVNISSASLGNHLGTVDLRVAPLDPAKRYRVRVSGVKDQAVAGNVMTEDLKELAFYDFDVLRINSPQPYAVEMSGSSLTIQAGGRDIWDYQDEFVYCYRPVSGNFDVKLKVESMILSDVWAKAGIMARESTAPGSRHIFNVVTPETGNNLFAAQWRDTTDGMSGWNEFSTPRASYPNSWMRLQRLGSSFYYYYSDDGINWVLYGSHDSASSPAGSLPADLLLGVAVTSHNSELTTEAMVSEYENVPAGWPGIVSAPQNRVVEPGTDVTLVAVATGLEPLHYQWLKNGLPIEGATSATLLLANVQSTSSGRYSVVVSNPVGSVTSAAAMVLANHWGPELGPIILEGPITIPEGMVLRIDAGTHVGFKNASSGINIMGSLDVRGTADNPVLFTSWRDDALEYLPEGSAGAPIAGDWRGFYVVGSGGNISLNHAILRYANSGIYTSNDRAIVKISNSVMTDCGYALQFWGGSYTDAVIGNTLLARNRGGGNLHGDSRTIFRNVTIADNADFGIELGDCSLTIESSIVSFNSVGLRHVGPPPSVIIRNSCFFNSTEIVWSGQGTEPQPFGRDGNLNADPRFVGHELSDYNLAATSPCIDSGRGQSSLPLDILARPRHDDLGMPNIGSGFPAYADMGAYEKQDDTPLADLAIAAISKPAPEFINSGSPFEVTWTVTNIGARPAEGASWVDKVYLSTDPYLSEDDLLIEEVIHNTPLGSGESYQHITAGAAPFNSSSILYVLVHANVNRSLQEAVEQNNIAASEGVLAINLPVLSLSQNVTGTLKNDEWVYVRFNATPGNTVIMNLDAGVPYAQCKFLAQYGKPPSLDSYEAGGLESTGTTQQLRILSPQEGIYYLGIKGENLASLPVNFTITSERAALQVESITPNRVGNGGRSTIQITGVSFAPAARAQLQASGGQLIEGESYWQDAATLFATFDLAAAGAVTGVYDLIVINPDGTQATKIEALYVEAGGFSRLEARLAIPGLARPGRTVVLGLELINTGNLDLPSPLLQIKASSAECLWTLPGYGTLLEGSNVFVMGLSSDGPPRVLRPQQSQNLAINLVIPFRSEAVCIELGALTSDFPLWNMLVDWNQLATHPVAGADPTAWSNFWNVFALQFGTTWADGTINLAQWAQHLLTAGGTLEHSAKAVLALAIQETLEEMPASSTGLENEAWILAQSLLDQLTLPRMWQGCINVQTSQTPEDKFGPSGYDSAGTTPSNLERFIAPGERLNYRIEFWNKPDAPVPTQDAVIEDVLDPSVFDLSTLQFGRFGFLKWDVSAPGGQAIETRVDMRPEMNLAVEVKATFNPNTGKIHWWFHCIDPDTGGYPDDPMAGFLPPFNPETGYEIGWVEFSVRPKVDLPSGARILNQAFVEFDFAGDILQHPAPKEQPWVNTIDAGHPNSDVLPLPAESAQAEFSVRWNGSDESEGSGVDSYDIYFTENDGPWQLWKKNTPDTSAVFSGKPGRRYAFYSQARDNVGNLELASTIADAQTTVAKNIPSLSWESPASIVYGTPLSDAQLNATTSVKGAFVYIPPLNHVLYAGSDQILRVTFTPDDLSANAVVTASVYIDVTPALLTITAEDQSMQSGTSLPTLTAKFSGFVNGDTVAALNPQPILATTATASSPVGSYPIMVSGAASPNYTITFIDGTLTVTPPGLWLTIEPSHIAKATRTTVTFQLYVPPDPDFATNSPNVHRENGKGWPVFVPNLYDDGTHGDVTAKDNIYTAQLVMDEKEEGAIQFRASVVYKNKSARTFSNTSTVTVGGQSQVSIKRLPGTILSGQFSPLSLPNTDTERRVLQSQSGSRPMEIMIHTTPGKTYVLEYTENLLPARWIPMKIIVGDGTTQSVIDSRLSRQRYYRIQEQ